MKNHESAEMYLETILLLGKRNGKVRSIDIAKEMDYSKPSVSRAVGLLKDREYINVDSDGYITLTDKGRKIAESIYDRHTSITKFLNQALGVDEETAMEDACRIEHVISEDSFVKLKEWLKDNDKTTKS